VGITMFTIGYIFGFLVCEKKCLIYQGRISGLRIHDYVLSGAEIKEIYNKSLKPTSRKAA
ncbi:unnamed protein product, partial [marine sediment metagenome]